jgi:hypothetical protein
MHYLVRLAEFYPNDFDSDKLDGLELVTFIDNVRADRRFDNLNGISDLAKLMVQTNKHITFPLIYQLLKLVTNITGCHSISGKMFLAMNIVKKVM